MEEKNTPLWLDLKTSYIDDNFEKLLPYLQNASNRGDAFYATTMQLLSERVEDLIHTLTATPLQEEEETDAQRASFNVRLLSAWLLTGAGGGDPRTAFIAMLGQLRLLVPKFAEDIIRVETGSLFHEGIEYGFTWDDVTRFSSEIFGYKVCNNTRFSSPRTKPLWWNGKGSVCISGDSMYVLPTREEKSVKALSESPASFATDFSVKVMPAGRERLKQSQSSDVRAIHDFTGQFIEEMLHAAAPASQKRRLLSYGKGDRLTVRVAGIHGETVTVESTDDNYSKLKGALVFGKKSLLYYYSNMFAWYMQPGDTFTAEVEDPARQTFTIDRTFVEYIVSDCQENYMDGEYSAVLIDTNQAREYVWLNSVGIPVYTEKDPSYGKGDFAFIQATECGEGRYLGKIDGRIVDPVDSDEDRFQEAEIRRDCIRSFVREEQPVAEQPKSGTAELDPAVMSLLLRHLFILQKHMMKPSERTMLLSISRILAEMLGDGAAAEYIGFTSAYLRALVLFATDGNVRDVKLSIPQQCLESEAARMRIRIVDLLQQWGRDGSEAVLNQAITEFQESAPMLSRIARIIQTSNNMQEIVTGASLNILKREVIKALQLEVGDEADLEEENGIYLGVESGSVEFKESVVFPPNNGMQPDENRQIRNVLRGVCAFLNSQSGGTLYLGVSDAGYVKGIQGDLDHLHITSIDTYMRVHIQDPAKKLLGLDAIANIRMEPMYDNRVVAIHVEPVQHRIVTLDGKAYLRINAESREMSDFMVQQQLGRKVFTNREKAANLSMLQQALTEKRRVVLHNYASSNSNTFSDRTVEAYGLVPESNIIICLDMKDRACKVFNLSRIGYVEILETPWSCQGSHRDIPVDAFHMTGEKSIRCCLQLDLMARNLLIEEFPRAKDSLSKVEGQNDYILDIEVRNIAGIGRFYIGLANHISLLNAPELKAYAEEFAQQHLPGK